MNVVHFWVIATLMVIATTAVIAVPLYWRASAVEDRGLSPGAHPARRWPAFALTALVPLAALGIYAANGNGAALGAQSEAGDDIAALHARATAGADRNGGDLEAAIARLRARLDADPLDAGGWRLLATSYAYLGRTSEAEQANQRAADLEAAGAGSAVARTAAELASGSAPTELERRAQEHRKRREFRAANVAFAELARSGGMNADLWADYADSLGGEHGLLDDTAAAMIGKALQIDPGHEKALWLLGTRHMQRNDFAAALATWQQLAVSLPDDSADRRIIAANIEEARGKLAAATTAAPAKAALRGAIDIDPRWRGRIPDGATLFVLARAADEPGPPLAVLRMPAARWPLRFVLDDSHAMLPTRRLSSHARVVLEARISRSGNALAQPGDLRAVSPVLDPRTADEQNLVIAEEVTAAGTQGG